MRRWHPGRRVRTRATSRNVTGHHTATPHVSSSHSDGGAAHSLIVSVTSSVRCILGILHSLRLRRTIKTKMCSFVREMEFHHVFYKRSIGLTSTDEIERTAELAVRS